MLLRRLLPNSALLSAQALEGEIGCDRAGLHHLTQLAL